MCEKLFQTSLILLTTLSKKDVFLMTGERVYWYKGKGHPLVCGSYRAIMLLEQPMKVLERVLEK